MMYLQGKKEKMGITLNKANSFLLHNLPRLPKDFRGMEMVKKGNGVFV